MSSYTTKKLTIKNRKGQNMAVLVEIAEKQKGLAFVMHGLGGYKEQLHLQTIAESFVDFQFTVVRFDTTNTFGESDGQYEDATVTSYFEDLEDVIAWASMEELYQSPFVLSGHSLGGMCVTLFAEKFPDKVLALAPFAPTVAGELSVEAFQRVDREKFSLWKSTGWREDVSPFKPERIKRLPWSHMEDRMNYNTLTLADNLEMPVLLIVGSEDVSTPPDHVEQLYNAIPKNKEFHIIQGAPHNMREAHHLEQVKEMYHHWLRNILAGHHM